MSDDSLWSDYNDYDPDYEYKHIYSVKDKQYYRKSTCKYCNYGNLYWKQDENSKWKLHKPNGDIHLCKAQMKKK